MQYEEGIKSIIAEQLSVNLDEVREDALLVDDLGADPYDLDELASALCNEFDMEIDEEEVELWNTVAEIMQTVFDKMEQ